MLHITEELIIAAGETKQVRVYQEDHPELGKIGLLETSFALKDEGIILLNNWYEGYNVLYLHKLLTTESFNPYPRSTTRRVMEEQYTTIEADKAIAHVLDVHEKP